MITKDTLIIGKSATIEAELFVGKVIIYGDVVGNIHAAESIDIHAPAKVRGNIDTPSLNIEHGVIYEGTCKMENIENVVLAKFSKNAGKTSPSPLSTGINPEKKKEEIRA